MEDTLRTIELEFTILEFYSNFVVSRVREGVVLSKKQVGDLVEVCSDFYNKNNFVYISKRVNNYNVDPTVYLNLEKVENLAGIAIVSTKVSSLKMANFEQTFSKLPFTVFIDMEDAVDWTLEILQKKSTSSLPN